jgi:ribosomal protein S18 acetylase RimI-like enzyme
MLGPGSSVPQWAENLETQEFCSAWGTLGEFEVMWLTDDCAFARWRMVPRIGEAELLRIAVCPSQRRKGIAKRLISECMKYMEAHECPTLRLEVRASNGPARALYLSLGWRQTGLRKGYYSDGEDAAEYVVQRRLMPLSQFLTI